MLTMHANCSNQMAMGAAKSKNIQAETPEEAFRSKT